MVRSALIVVAQPQSKPPQAAHGLAQSRCQVCLKITVLIDNNSSERRLAVINDSDSDTVIYDIKLRGYTQLLVY